MMKLVKDDPWLAPYEQAIEARYNRFSDRKAALAKTAKSLVEFASGHDYYGIHFDQKTKGWWYREWAPGANQMYLVGDFNNWENTHALQSVGQGNWEIFIPESSTLSHLSRIKVRVVSGKGTEDRIPAYVRYACQDERTKEFYGVIWSPPKAFKWTDRSYTGLQSAAPLIYECHVGMALEAEKVGTYREFADEVLPRIKAGGYNALQMMAIAEHPYYGSFGYHVSNFFAPSSRFGTPDDLKYLVNKAHKLGLAVIMDLVHSHAVKNTAEGLNGFDGTDDQYFHPGERGEHPGWDSMLFNYGKTDVLRFLLSNVRYWLEEFHFDGFRYDGITSMLYWHHGEGVAFDHYDKYFLEGVEHDAVTYLQLANDLTKAINPSAVSIAEDMSGMPGMCRPLNDGGIGFDFRLGMGIPDYWIKILKHQTDEQWDIGQMVSTLMNRRAHEKNIAYAESHDQALVGDKTLAFWLMDKEMYWHMSKGDPSLIIDRGIALHKMIRLITAVAGGEGYLNFIGNEFGHPEWIDFPREGNGWSHKHARRQWSLVDNPDLRYTELAQFDQSMLNLLDAFAILSADPAQVVHLDGFNKVVILERNNCLFAFNFHWEHSIPDYRFRPHVLEEFELIHSSDAKQFGGHDRVSIGTKHLPEMGEISIYLPTRTAVVLKKCGI